MNKPISEVGRYFFKRKRIKYHIGDSAVPSLNTAIKIATERGWPSSPPVSRAVLYEPLDGDRVEMSMHISGQGIMLHKAVPSVSNTLPRCSR